MRAAGTLALIVGLVGWPNEAPRAQGFGFLFGQPERDYRYRATRRSRPRVAAVPMPVPRPHFPEDEPRAKTVLPPASAETKNPDSPPPTPTAGTGATTPESTPKAGAEPKTPPLPPEKPAALIAPADGKSSEAERTKTPNSAVEPKPPESKASEIKAPEIKAPTHDVKTPPLPAVAPSGATTAFDPRQPTADATCPGRLQATQVDAAPISLGPQPDARCVVQQPVKLDHLILKDGSRISFPDRPTLACATADIFATYVRDLLVPLAKGTYGVRLDSVWTGPGLECRSRDHIFGAKLSAHGQGLAIDIAQLKLGDGRMLAVGDPKSDEDQAFETAARAAGCGYFHTVLGPGSDTYHRTHWHFDLEERGSKGDSKFCK
jgi:hypothetical protein